MIRSLRRILAAAVSVAVSVTVSVAVVAAASPPATAAQQWPAAATPPRSGGPAAVHTVTLVTGDVIQLSEFADGRQVAAVDYSRTPSRHGFQMSERDGDVYVVPNEALPYVASGKVDKALFNITDLVAGGYSDGVRSTLPLLITGEPAGSKAQPGAQPKARAGTRVAAPPTPPGASRKRELRSIGAVAVAEDKSRAHDFWDAVTAGPRTLSGGVGKIWLDRRVRADLTDSVPQIGAPAAWHAGYDGTGVKVAVLDTGYDPTHPDLAGRIAGAANFTPESDPVDRFGHGTHVAATIAGSGTAGRPGGKGVAPGADLLVGKVLDTSGSGDLSWVIAGMEWAVGQGARVVNVSLGAQAYEGPDPVAEAVDALTASSGALFVVSAGNSGPDVQTIGTPGTASSALTVGAVSKQDELADFSSRGPRLGDGMVKPEITAPGVGIVAARAAGPSLGEVVDASYTSLSGTSMAAPHVSGAAALLAQKHPDWRADRLKAALVSGADPQDVPVWEQGAGRVDVPTALDQRVSVDQATISFGKLTAHSPDRTATITYHNTGKRPVALALDAQAHDVGATGKPAVLTVTPNQLTVPAGGSAQATVRLDATATPANLYAGILTARGEHLQVRTPIGFNVTAPTHTLTIEAVDRDGVAAHGFDSRAELWNLDTGESYYGFFFGGTPATVELPAGRYALMNYISSVDVADWPKDATAIGDPELTIDGDRTVHFDARTASELVVDTPDPTTMSRLGLAWQRTTATRSLLTGISYNPEMVRHTYATPTRPVSVGTFDFFTRWELNAPPLTARVDGADGAALHDPRLLDGAPALDGTHTMPLVDGGGGTAGELAAAGARDAAVLIRYTGWDAVEGQLRAAGTAGARVVLLAADQPGFVLAVGPWAAMPSYAIGYEDGQRLRTRLATGPATITLTGIARSPYRYDLLFTERGAIPADLHYQAEDLKLATLDTEYHRYGPRMQAIDNRAGFPDGVNVAFSFLHMVTEPHRRTDHVSTDGVAWQTSVVVDAVGPTQGTGSMFGPPRTLRPGQRAREVWFPALTRPATPNTLPSYAYGVPANRAHDAIRVAIPQYANGDATQYGWVDRRFDRAELTLRQGATVIGRSEDSSTQFTVPEHKAEYQLTLDVARIASDDQAGRSTSTATSTTWTFRSKRPAHEAPVVLPLPQIGYDVATDLANAVRADRPYPLVLRPGYQPGATGPGRFDVDVAVSYDDGAHWQPAATTGGPVVTATVPAAPAGASFATIRVTARDAAGNAIEQTISRAWKVIR
ncbi:MAG TPA: S8 family serine peptidase [Micromonosporaceae bacterium]